MRETGGARAASEWNGGRRCCPCCRYSSPIPACRWMSGWRFSVRRKRRPARSSGLASIVAMPRSSWAWITRGPARPDLRSVRSGQARLDVDLGLERAVHRALVRDLQELRPLLAVQRPLELDRSLDAIDLADLRLALGTVLGVHLLVT